MRHREAGVDDLHMSETDDTIKTKNKLQLNHPHKTKGKSEYGQAHPVLHLQATEC